MFKAYFDESGTHQNSSLVCVAGYLFSRENAVKFGELWKEKVKPLLPNNVKVFHAVDCYAQQKDFKNISEEDRDAIFDAMIAITKDTVDLGIIVGIEPSEYESAINKQDKIKRMIGTPYTLCALTCTEYAVDRLIEKQLEGDIFYYFEDGCKNRGELEKFLLTISQSPALKQKYRFYDYGFPTKEEAVQLQAADLLAWEWQRSYATAYQPGCENREWRMTLKGLVEKPHRCEHLTQVQVGLFILKVIIDKFNPIKSNSARKHKS
jgi:hypothetical protein